MTEEELNKMIGEFLPYPSKGQHHALKRFAKLVAAAEREACAQICEALDDGSYAGGDQPYGIHYARAIRARGQE